MKLSILLLTACAGCGDSVLMATDTDTGTDATSSQADTEVIEFESMPIPPIVVFFDPPDLTTRFEGTIRLQVGQSGPHVPESLLEVLRERVSMRSATLEAVNIDVAVGPQTEAEGRGTRSIFIEPREPMEAGWYELVLDFGGLRETSFDGLKTIPSPALIPIGDDVFKTRLNPSSAPVIQRIDACFDQVHPGEASIVVRFSELIDFVPKPSTIDSPPLRAFFDVGHCSMVPNLQDNEPDTFAKVFQYLCTGITAPQRVSLAFNRTLLTESGEALLEYESGTPPSLLELDLADGFAGGECKYLRPR